MKSLWRLVSLLLWLAWSTPAWSQEGLTEYTTQTKTATITAASTDVTFWTPLSGHHIALQGCEFSSTVAASISLKVSGVNVIPPIYMESYGERQIGGTHAPIYTSATDAVLTYTVIFAGHTPSLDTRVSILCWGYEYRE